MTRTENQVASIEELIVGLPDECGTPEGYMREHLETIRFYLIGSMPEECTLTRNIARDLLPEIADADRRKRIGEFLSSL